MESGGIQALYDPRIGETTIFPKDIEVGEGETPLRAVARIILPERPARNLLEMISTIPLYLNTKKGRNWLRIAGKQYAGTRGFQSGQANVPNEAGVVNLAKSQAPKLARPGPRSPIRYAGAGPYRVQSQGWRATLTGNALPKEFRNLIAKTRTNPPLCSRPPR